MLLSDGCFYILEGRRIESNNTHGTGCTLSSAIACFISKGMDFYQAARLSKEYITTAIENSFSIGKGVGPVGHFIELYKRGQVDYE